MRGVGDHQKSYDKIIMLVNRAVPMRVLFFQGSERTADYSKLLEYGLDSKVADKLDDIYKVQK